MTARKTKQDTEDIEEKTQPPIHHHTPFSDRQIRALMGRLNDNRVASRPSPGGGRKMSYLEAWDVRATLIRIFGFANFDVETLSTSVININPEFPKKNGGTQFQVTMQATVRLKIHLTGAVYTESAISSQAGPDVGEVADFAVKTAVSDALKRTAINLGTQFGLSLYNNGVRADVVSVLFDPAQHEALLRAQKELENPNAPDQVARALASTPPVITGDDAEGPGENSTPNPDSQDQP